MDSIQQQIDFNNLSGVFHYLGVPMTSGLGIEEYFMTLV
jgi:hypothetical protein